MLCLYYNGNLCKNIFYATIPLYKNTMSAPQMSSKKVKNFGIFFNSGHRKKTELPTSLRSILVGEPIGKISGKLRQGKQLNWWILSHRFPFGQSIVTPISQK